MTNPVPGWDSLAQLKTRFQGGIYQAIRRSRPANQEERDREALSGWPGSDPDGDLAPLAGIRRQDWNADVASKVIGNVAQRMRAERSFLTAVLFAPDTVLDALLNPAAGAARRARSSGRDIDAWIAMCLTCEAAWDAVNTGEFDDPVYAVGDAELLRPIAARIRFLVLTEPMRWRGEIAGTCWARQEDKDYGETGVLSRTFGIESWHLLVGRCFEARRAWLDYLDTYQSHPLLSQAEPGELEDELSALIFRQPGARFSARTSAPLGLSARRLAETVPLTAGDKAIIAEAADRHLLPRFALPAMIRLAFPEESPRRRRARMLYGITTAIAGLAAVGLAAGLLIHQATVVAAVFYLLVCAGVVVLGSNWSGVWLLRMPAASAVGVIALVSFLPGDWLEGPADGWLAILALGAASYGYLVVEARNHGVAKWASVRRALAVAAVGAAHALMVSLIGLVIVAPAFVNNGPALASLWRHPGYRHSGMELALATAWCLAVGVFSQILWDDRPITAQLAHLSWRSK
jgi:hypothetical protein